MSLKALGKLWMPASQGCSSSKLPAVAERMLCCGFLTAHGGSSPSLKSQPSGSRASSPMAGAHADMASGLQGSVMEHVTDFQLSGESLPTAGSSSLFGLILLNYKLPKFTPHLWSQSVFRVCADGGANRLYDDLPGLIPGMDAEEVRRSHLPNAIKGDLDSIRPDVRDFYTKMGVEIIDASEDQDTTDLHKCIDHTLKMLPEIENQGKILVAGAMGGRLDHELAHLHALHLFPHLRIVLFGDESLAFLLPGGVRHSIRPDTRWEGPHCGLIPLDGPAPGVTTTGLRWDMRELNLSFGTIISACNQLDGDNVQVDSTCSLVWTTELRGA